MAEGGNIARIMQYAVSINTRAHFVIHKLLVSSLCPISSTSSTPTVLSRKPVHSTDLQDLSSLTPSQSLPHQALISNRPPSSSWRIQQSQNMCYGRTRLLLLVEQLPPLFLLYLHVPMFSDLSRTVHGSAYPLS